MSPIKTPVRITTRSELESHINRWRFGRKRIALVPTMGALHDGHLSLVKHAAPLAERVIVSIFVNPAQFGAGEDLATYPRDEDGDVEKLSSVGADLVYMPLENEIYPAGFATKVSVGGISEGLCGAARPGHFDGVATIVTKLLNQTRPDIAIFGEKDFQQLQVIKRLTRDLDLPAEIIGAPIIRESDGLAMSSRNQYLSTKEREVAPLLYRTLNETAFSLVAGQTMRRLQSEQSDLLQKAGFEVEYLELRDIASFAPLTKLADQPARLLIAAKLGRTRLIDNIPVMK